MKPSRLGILTLGKVSAFITKQENIDICVRCGGPNSGHSFVDEHGRTIVLRQLPTGYVRSKTRLLIPAGALIDLDVLKNEIEALHIAPERIGIDPNCFVIGIRYEATQGLYAGDRITVENHFSGYQEFGGLRFPTVVTRYLGGLPAVVLQIQSLRFNNGFGDSDFRN